MITASHQLKIGILSVCLILFLFSSCDRRKEEINQQVNKLYSSVIDLPYPDMEALSVDSAYLTKKADYQILVFVDSAECTPCYASHHGEWEGILKECRKYTPSITLSIIIESREISMDVKEKFLASDFGKTIFIDKTGVFRKRNPVFPESNIMHVLLLDKNNQMVLVGNPLNNEKIEELLYAKLRESTRNI